ncbi:MAG: hypothetical protein LQ352_000813 [Teloschistes flavicans]|nr:MAG: hypothetical protein LQ352_000813 [Teloschistes flavicans]
MTRPLKKRNGVVAGMPRAGGVRHSPIGSSQADGDGLACEFQPLALQVRGVFPLLLHRLQRQTPTAYKLPLALRTYYEDVITGEDGEYEENNVPSKARTRGGYDVPVDTLRLKDGKDNTILCYKCNESAMGRRELVECDFCNLHWHLDCVDPPLASAPKRFGKGTWKCPNHIDSEVALPRSASGRKYKVRRPKDPRVVEPAIQRGIKNNGIIEVEDEISEEEDQPPGTIFRLSAKAIQLDFISKIKQQRLATARVGKHESEAIKADQRHQQHAPDGKVQRRALSCTNNRSLDNIFDGRTPAERQAASSLAQFARSDPESQLSGDRVEELVSTLITEAPSIGITDICRYTHEDQSNGDPAPPASDVKMYEVNGGTAAVSTRAKAGASNKAAYAANHANTIETAPNSSILPHSLTAQEELAELLKLDATLKAKIAAIRATTTAAAI